MEQAHENKMTRDETLKVALMVGKILLKSGAETYRVEDTINRFCIANGYEVDIFVTPTVIILGNEQVDSFNCVSRIRYRTTNLGMISEMNDMSYKFERWPMSYRGTMAWLEEKLKALHLKFCDVKDKNFMRKWNGGEVNVLLAHPASAGHGINLQYGGSICVWSTIPFDLEHWAQANARLSRQGQIRGVQIHSFMAKNTVEKNKYLALRKKETIATEFIEITK